MLPKSIRIIATGLSIAYLLVVFCYTAPEQIIAEPIKKTAKVLLPGFLKQTWALFAPPPTKQKIVYQYRYQDRWSSWVCPVESEVALHQKYRVTWHQHLSLAAYNLSWCLRHYENKAVWKKRCMHFLRNYTQYKYGIVPDEIEAKMIMKNNIIRIHE